MKLSKQMFIIPEDNDKLKQVLKDIHCSISILDNFKPCKDNRTCHIDVVYRDGGTDSFSTIYPPQTFRYRRTLDKKDEVNIYLIRVDDVIYIINDNIVKTIVTSKIPF